MSKYNWFWLDGSEWCQYSPAHSEELSRELSMGSRTHTITLANGARYVVHLTPPLAQHSVDSTRNMRKVKYEPIGLYHPPLPNSNPISSNSTNSANTASTSSQGSKPPVPETRYLPPLNGFPPASELFKLPLAPSSLLLSSSSAQQQPKTPSVNYFETVPPGTHEDLSAIISVELKTGARQSRFTHHLVTFCQENGSLPEDLFSDQLSAYLRTASGYHTPSQCHVTADTHLFKDSCVQYELWKKPLVLTNNLNVPVSFSVLDHADSDGYAFFSCTLPMTEERQRINSKQMVVMETRTRYVSQGEIPAKSSVSLEIGVVFLNKRDLTAEEDQWSKSEFHFERLVRICVEPKTQAQPISMATRQQPVQYLFVAVILEGQKQPKSAVTFWQPSSSEYLKQDKIGQGTFGYVHRAEVRGFPCAMKQWNLVDKNHQVSEYSVTSARSELKLLSSFQHPHVIPFICGVDTNGPNPNIFAFMKSGSMDLKKRYQDSSNPVQPELAFSFALQVARGLHYMHSKGYIHRDIKPGNVVLIDDIAFLVDVGEAKEYTEQQKRSSLVGTAEYMAPEIFKSGAVLTPAIDIFSFGIMLWELCQRQVPRSRADPDWPKARLAKGDTPPLSPDFSVKYPLVQDLYKQCVAVDSSSRPDASALVRQLEIIVLNYQFETSRLGRARPKASSSSAPANTPFMKR